MEKSEESHVMEEATPKMTFVFGMGDTLEMLGGTKQLWRSLWRDTKAQPVARSLKSCLAQPATEARH